MVRNKAVDRLVFLALIFSVALFWGCSKPPTEDILKAEKAVQEAKQQEADYYAADEFAKAENTLKQAQDFVAVKKYKEAKQAALDAGQAAQHAVSLIEANRETMKSAAEQTVQEIKTEIDSLKAMTAKALKKKKSVLNREEIQGMIGKWEIDLVSIEEKLQALQVWQARDELVQMKDQVAAQTAHVASILEPGTEKQ